MREDFQSSRDTYSRDPPGRDYQPSRYVPSRDAGPRDNYGSRSPPRYVWFLRFHAFESSHHHHQQVYGLLSNYLPQDISW